MKILFLFLFPLLSYSATFPLTVNKKTFTLVSDASWVKGPTGPSLLVRYHVKADHLPQDSEWTMESCTHHSPPMKGDIPKDLILPAMLENQQVGWWIKGQSICGNTTSLRAHLVYVANPDNQPVRLTVDSKLMPILRKRNGNIEVWSAYQEWGAGGTAGSFFVPEKRTLKNWGAFQLESIGIDDKTYPDFPDLDIKYFPSLYVSGIHAKDPDLMKFAVDKYFQADEQTKELYGWIGMPVSKAEAMKEVEAMRVLSGRLKVFVHRK